MTIHRLFIFQTHRARFAPAVSTFNENHYIYHTMPELPEVETIVRGLAGFLPGKTVAEVLIHHPKPVQKHGAKAFCRIVSGKTIGSVERVGKFIQISFTAGDRLIVHLRMTGKFIVAFKPPALTHPHVRLVFHFTDNTALLYSDLRIFGTFRFYKKDEPVSEYCRLGRDPIKENISVAWFLSQCRTRGIAIKPLLLDQKTLCGLGNIYACEALFCARVSPMLPARELSISQAKRLLSAIRSILMLAIKNNGTSVRDFRAVDEKSGGFQRLLKVYGREGERCPRCRNSKIKRIKQAQRSTFFCPKCQG